MACDCINDINRQLDGQQLETTIALSRDLARMTVETFTNLERLDTGRLENRRTKPRLAAHTFCPFCGVRYVQDPRQA